MSPSFFAPLRRPAVWALACLFVLANHAFAAPTSVNFGPVLVGQTSATRTVVVNFQQAGQIKAIKAVLQGVPKLDYSAIDGSCHTGSVYQIAESCTMQATFTPLAPGVRNGAIVVTNAAGATIATAYLTGIGEGPLATFSGGAPVLAAYDAGSGGWTVDGGGNIYYLLTGSAPTIHKLTPTGGFPFVTLPSNQYDFSTVALRAIDGAGNLILTSQDIVYKVDPSGVVSRLAEAPQSEGEDAGPHFLHGVAALGNGELYVGSGPLVPYTGPSYPGASAPYYLVHPAGSISEAGEISDDYTNFFINDIAVGPKGETYLGTFLNGDNAVAGSVYTASSYAAPGGSRICEVPNEQGLAVDASGTLLVGSQTSRDVYTGPLPPAEKNCDVASPVIESLPFANPIVDTHGDVYVESTTSTTHPVYKYVRTQVHGVVFSSHGTETSYGSMAITNSGNMPLNLSHLEPTLGGSASQSFNIEQTNCGESLAPAASCTISLSYTPSGFYATLPATASLLLGGLPNQQEVVPLTGFPYQ